MTTDLPRPRPTYRYTLTRELAPLVLPVSRVLWVMLNPSTANARDDDATVRRCIGFTERWQHTRLDVVNLFAMRSTDPSKLRDYMADERIGPVNDHAIRTLASKADTVVLGWGANGTHYHHRIKMVCQMLRGHELMCLGTTTNGHPMHPVRLAKTTKLRTWSPLSMLGVV